MENIVIEKIKIDDIEKLQRIAKKTFFRNLFALQQCRKHGKIS